MKNRRCKHKTGMVFLPKYEKTLAKDLLFSVIFDKYKTRKKPLTDANKSINVLTYLFAARLIQVSHQTITNKTAMHKITIFKFTFTNFYIFYTSHRYTTVKLMKTLYRYYKN